MPGDELPLYAPDLLPLLTLPLGEGSAQQGGSDASSDQPLSIAHLALAHWNAYVTTRDEADRQQFIAHVRWLVARAEPLAEDAGGWPVQVSRRAGAAPERCLSALAQGVGVSVLVRAYRLTGDETFLEAARRAVRCFEVDILDGGVRDPLGDEGGFFEEIAVYPAAHRLRGAVLALFALLDYAALADDPGIALLIERSHVTLHSILEAYDTGSWTRADLLHRRLAFPQEQTVQVKLLAALASRTGCSSCAARAARWTGYQRQARSRLRYLVASHVSRLLGAGMGALRRRLFSPDGVRGQPAPASPSAVDAVCVPITLFPLMGGMRSVLAGVARAMADEWHMEYLTSYRGAASTEHLAIQHFGNRLTSYLNFPNVWFYILAGWRKLLMLLRQGRTYRLMLPQDGLYTGLFAALLGKLAGIRVVCIDHGSITLPYSDVYRRERIQRARSQPWPKQIMSRLRLIFYWPSLRLMAWIATHFTDFFLAAGEDVAEAYQRHLGVHPSSILCFPFLVEVDRYAPLEPAARACLRAQHHIPADALMIAMVNRLAPEKGVPIALQGIKEALSALPADLRARVRVVIAGDGPLRKQVEGELCQSGLASMTTLWGEATPEEVRAILGMSDIFLYTGLRGINSMAVLEAMAAGCAVIASTAPQSLAKLLAEGRGLAIPVGDARSVSMALAELLADPNRCHAMGQRARAYVAAHHSAAALKRCLLRATYWSPKLSAPPLEEARKTAVGCSEGRG